MPANIKKQQSKVNQIAIKSQTDKVDYIPPKTGQTHGLFGVRYLKFHQMRDPNWRAEDKCAQYSNLTKLYERQNKLRQLRETAERKRNVEKLKLLKKEVKDKRQLLQNAFNGDFQTNKTIFKNHPDLQRAFQNKKAFDIVKVIHEKTCVLQNQMNKCIFEKKELEKKYEHKILEVSKKQDFIRCFDMSDFKEEIERKRLLVLIKNSETRTKATSKVNQKYQTIIDTILKDSLYYEPVLNALRGDMAEQKDFIEKAFKMGMPAIKNIDMMSKEYNDLERNFRKQSSMRLKDLMENQKVLDHYDENVINLVRRDKDFISMQNRYDRDTPSMTNLKESMEETEKIIKIIKISTLSNDPDKILSKIKNQPILSTAMKSQMFKKEEIKNMLEEKVKIATVSHDLLLNDLPEIYNDETLNEIQKLKNAIKKEKEKQEEHNKNLRSQGEIVCLMRMAFQHMLHILRNVGSPEEFKDRVQKNPDLQLPLLKFCSLTPILDAPPMMEDDVFKLTNITKKKIQMLMEYYNQKIEKTKDPSTNRLNYCKAVLSAFPENYYPSDDDDIMPQLEESHKNRNVPDRRKIKLTSDKMIQQFAKDEEGTIVVKKNYVRECFC